MKKKLYNYVEFLSPGTFFSETSLRPIKEWDIKEAIKLSKKVSERYNAKPYGFRFTQESGYDSIEVDGEKAEFKRKHEKQSGIYYLTGKLIKYHDLVVNHKPIDMKGDILASNLRQDPYIAVENCNSWKSTHMFNEDDCIVDWDGSIIISGNDARLVEYRKFAKKDIDKYYKSKGY